MPERSRRRPLVLASTKSLANSLLGASLNLRPTNQPSRSSSITPLSTDDSSPCLELRAGLLRFPDGNSVKFDFKHTGRDLDNSALVGLPICTLKRLAIVSGSLVLLKNVQMNLQRVAQVVALDSPTSRVGSSEVEAESSGSPVVMKVLPSIDLYTNCQHIQLDEGYAYLSPLLAFNAGVHTSSFISLRSSGRDALASLFDIDNEQASGEGNINCIVNLRLEPWPQFPRYASHLRVSFVKVPECGIIEFLRGKSSTEAKCRQDMIDTALNDYFSVDRYLSKGDVFCIEINWSCNSDICYRCRRRKQKSADDIIHFLVVALDPSEEQILRVNRNQTAFILGGSIPSAVPPAFLVPQPTNVVPVRVEMIKTLASILIPSMSPFLLSSEFKVTLLLHGLAGSGKRTLVKYVAQLLGLHVVEYSCHSLMESSEKKASAALAQAFNTADRYSPAILLLHHFDVFRNVASPEGSQSDQAGLASDIASVIRESTDPVKVHGDIFMEGKSNGGHESMGGETINRHKVLLIAALDNPEGLPPNIRRCFSHEIGVDPLTEDQRATILSQFLQRIPEVSTNVGVEDLVRDMAAQTSGFLPRDLRALMAEAGVNLTLKSNNPVIARDEEDPNPTDVQKELVEQAPQIHSNEGLRNALTASLDQMKKRSAAALGTPKVPDVKWEDVGGLEDVKKAILDTIQLPLVHKELFSSGLRKRSGVLLYGPPGTGKTLLAKAVATECSLNFLSVKGPEVINMYIGQSESNIREIFEKAGNARPCVIFFDELDSLAPARGASGDSGGVMDRVVSQMLAAVDDLSNPAKEQNVFVIGATNRPDLIDRALLRPGRFDKLLYVGIDSDPVYRERILKALTRKFKLHEDVSLLAIAKRCPTNFTGADLYALCADAWFCAAKRKVSGLQPNSPTASNEDEEVDKNDSKSVVVEYDDFVKVLEDLTPSLSPSEIRNYEMLREQFEGPLKTQ